MKTDTSRTQYGFSHSELPRWLSDKKNLPTNAGDMGSIPGLGRSPGVGNGNPLQYSFLENSLDRRAWRAVVCLWGYKEWDITE